MPDSGRERRGHFVKITICPFPLLALQRVTREGTLVHLAILTICTLRGHWLILSFCPVAFVVTLAHFERLSRYPLRLFTRKRW